jgi:tetratricopeptide (TPR) repeat protein
MSDPIPELSSGQALDRRFTLVRPLGEGGIATVWLVHDAELDEEVVAKILPPDASDERIALLRRECREARRLVHPGIARVYEFHRTGERAFLTMEYIDGRDLSDLRGESLERLLPVASSLARALAYAHSRGVVHGNLELSKVVRDATGEFRLVDFGIGALRQGEAAGFGDKSRPSDDLHAFGAMLYELTTGHPPVGSGGGARRVGDGSPAPFPESRSLPQRYRSLVLGLLANSPDERPPEMAGVESELKQIQDELASSQEAHDPPDPGRGRLNPPPRVKTIEPIRLESTSPSSDRERGRSIVARYGVPMLLAAIVVALLLFVFVVLPRWAKSEAEPTVGRAAAESEEEPGLPGPDGADPAPAEDLQERAYSKQRAEQALGRLVELREDFERRGAASWGGKTYASAIEHADRGDAQMASGEFEAAGAEYEQAARALDQLGSVAVDLLRRALADGQQALEAGDEARATAAFGLAAEIAPDNQAAASGLRRAEVLDEVSEALLIADARERAGDWVEAERAYRQAVALDPMSLVAQESLARVQAHLSDDRFADFMSQGLAALQRGEYSEARQAFERAGSIRPDALQVAEGLLQVDQAEKLDALAIHRARATELEAAEQWEAAAEQYAAVIGLAPNVAFAQQGETRCRSRADLARRMAYHLDHPERLSSDEVFAEAKALVVEASNVQPAGPRHLEELARLESLLARAGTLVRVRLESDNLTDVAIYRVGRLGTFLEHDLELRPGRYTVVGSRSGYRDVRHELVVVAGKQPKPLRVSCEEKIGP